MTVDASWALSPSLQDVWVPPLQHRLFALVRWTHTGASKNGQGRQSTVMSVNHHLSRRESGGLTYYLVPGSLPVLVLQQYLVVLPGTYHPERPVS
jgi:hypothetical protein